MNENLESIPINIGTEVEIELQSQLGETERLNLTIVADEQADFKAGFLGVHTPLAVTILGQRAGRILAYRMGGIQRVKIISVRLSEQKQTENIVARREEVIRKAIQRSDYINMVNFANSFDSKWGDYDVDKIDPAEWGQEAPEDDQRES